MENLYWLGQIQPPERKLIGEKAFYLNQLMRLGYPIVPGFVVSATALQEFWHTYDWLEPLFAELPHSSLHLNVDESHQLSALAQRIRHEIITAHLPPAMFEALEPAGKLLQAPVLIFRPSVTLPSLQANASSLKISGLLESHVCRCEPEQMAIALKRTWAELFRARSLFCWHRLGIELQQISLGVLVQPLWPAIVSGEVQADLGAIEIQATWGLGKSIKLGEVVPDSYQLNPHTGVVQIQRLGSKTIAYDLIDPSDPTEDVLSSHASDCLKLYMLSTEQQNQYALQHPYLKELIELIQRVSVELGSACVLEWTLCNGKDVSQPQLYLTQAYPDGRDEDIQKTSWLEGNHLPVNLPPTNFSNTAIKGVPASAGQATAPAQVIASLNENIEAMPPGRILIASVILPDWLPLLKQAAGVVAEQGGMTSHGAILARELGIPAVVGAAGVTQLIQTGELVFIDGDKGEIYRLSEQHNQEFGLNNQELRMNSQPSHSLCSGLHSSFSTPLATQLFVNLSQPSSIEQLAGLPIDGVGLVRSELMLIEVLENQHPRQWLQKGATEEFVEKITAQLSQFARAFSPRPVFYRSLDLRSDELQSLVGADAGEEVNPTLGVHGTFSYVLDPGLFDLELQALAKLHQAGHTNVNLILPFVRSVEEFTFCRQRVEKAGLTQQKSFQLWLMAEVPSVLFLLPDYVKAGLQGISIGTNDLTQLLLAADRQNPQMAAAFDEHHPAVMRAVQHLIELAKQAGIPCSFCGGTPARYPDLIDQLVQWGIRSISVEPKAIESTYTALARAEQRLLLNAARHQLQ
ncbi:putative PEP-binding protein [Microcoleus sp. FACHB-672]|uniref:putative PEP-binding protein n=1 Tax=Microcoleus sp. FACHB-672 TaxID=2692825 RepID=UPI0016882941|nr:putative PEP-binding protein [Microcoleus sp. FACHB-672]MBD2043830.1 hypothetical protein [Microcoleus sp. FACHB-672]